MCISFFRQFCLLQGTWHLPILRLEKGMHDFITFSGTLLDRLFKIGRKDR